MVTRCKNLEQMLREGKIPIRGGWWIDAYNMVVSPIAGTIKARINHNNLYFVTELYEDTEDPPHAGLQPGQCGGQE